MAEDHFDTENEDDMNKLKIKFWLWALNSMEREFACSLLPDASQFCDCCLAIRETLKSFRGIVEDDQ